MRIHRARSLAALSGVVVVALASCAINKPTQQQVQQSFAAFTSGTSDVTSGAATTTRIGPPIWTYNYVFTLSNGGTITMVLNITSSDNLNNAPTPGESGTLSGSITFTNFSGSGYTFNGTIDVSGNFTTSSATNGDVLINETYNYTGSLKVTGNGVSSMTMNFSAAMSMDMNNGSVVSGPIYSGTVTMNDKYAYNVGSLSATASMLDPFKVIR